MTAVHATTVTARATRLELLILALASYAERAVTAHVERRVRRSARGRAEDHMSNARADACALGSIGILPR